MAGACDALRRADVLQHIGADDVVVLLAGEHGVQVALLEVGHQHAPVVRLGQARFDRVVVDAVDQAALEIGQELAKRAAARAQVQHPRADLDAIGQRGQRGVLSAADLAPVYVTQRREQTGRGGGQPMAINGRRRSQDQIVLQFG